jgi:putative membrane protein
MQTQNQPPVKRLHFILLIIFFVVFIWSAIKPYQLGNWFLEVTPLILGTGIILYTYKRFRLTTPIYILLFLGGIIVLIGGHYSYGNVPLFNWLDERFNLGRNHYDRFAHFANGFVWALTLREILLRTLSISRGIFLVALLLGSVLGISALYELVEWGVAMILRGNAEAFLGLQGDVWDTHWDMFLAFVGAIVGLVSFSKIHDHWLVKELNIKI